METGKTYPCRIYEYAPLLLSEAILFFEVQFAEDDCGMLGAAKFSRMQRGWRKRPPLEARSIDNWTQEFQEAWEVVYKGAPQTFKYQAKLVDNTIEIIDEQGNLWLTLV